MDDGTLFGLWLDERDERAFETLARRHASVVFDLAARALQDRTAADDVVQEALLDLALERSRRPIEVGVAAWLVRFAVCKARNRRASERSRARRQRVVGGRRAEVVMPDESLERSDELNVALARAEPGERMILAMRYLHGWGYARIGRALDLSEGAARVRVHRALRSVRARVGADDGADRDARLIGGLGALPLIGMGDTHVGAIVDSVLRSAKAQLAAEAAAAATAAPTVAHSVATGSLGRFTFHTLKFVAPALLLVAGGIAFDTPEGPVAPRHATHVAALTAADAASTPAAGALDTTEPRPGASSNTAPRPPAWDDGELGRLGRGEDGPGLDAPARRRGGKRAPVRAADAPKRDRKADTREADTERKTAEHARASCPILREATAARCDPASFDDERAGAFAGSAEGSSEPRTDLPPDAAAAVAATPSTPHSGSGRAVRGTPLDRLDPGRRELIDDAVALVRKLVQTDLATLAGKRRRVAREMRKVARRYRVQRRRIIRAAADGDAFATEMQAAMVSRLSKTRQVLSQLMTVALADGRRAGEIVWPEGADVEAALEDLVRVLGPSGDAAAAALPEGLDDGADSSADPAADDPWAADLPEGLFE